ncbi:MAG: protein kinase [Myxococcaceae bacterium]|nr:protein kinase [Myxococcaceae bacterium]
MAIQGGAPADDPDRGRRISKYEILTRLSVGGMAELFLAFTSGPGGFRKFVALKQILPDVKTDEFVKMFLDEARITAAFSHANIGQVFDLGEEAGELYLAMEFLAGQNLEQLMKAVDKRDEPLSPGFAARVIRDVCLGLHYAHHFVDPSGRSVAVVHRDMSPRNVMVTYDGGVKVIDFGIAKAKGRLGRTAVGMVKGTGGYMSPEQVRGHELDGRSDLFSAGVLLYEMLCGQRLFNAPGDAAMMMQIVEGEIPPPRTINPAVPEALDAVVMRALTRDKSKRFATGREMAKAIEAAMGPEIFDEERLAALMEELFAEKRQKTRALLEYASRDDARISEAAGALQDDPGDAALTAPVKRVPRTRPTPAPVPSARQGSGTPPPRARKPGSNPAQTAVPSTPRGARPRITARQEVEEAPEAEDQEPDNTLATQPFKARPGGRPGARPIPPRPARTRPPPGTPVDEDSQGSRWAGRLFLLVFFGAIGGLLYLEPVRAMLKPGYDSAVAWVRAELELDPPPPPEQVPWPPPPLKPPPNPLAPQENSPPPEPTPSEATAAAADPAPSEDPKAKDGKGPEKSGGAVAKTPKTGTSKPKPQQVAKAEPGTGPGATTPTAVTGTPPKDLNEQLQDEPNTTVEARPEGQAELVDTSSPQAMKKAKIGLLTLRTVPPAAVYDGQTSLGTTPLVKVPLNAGTYRLRLVDPEGNSRLFSAPVDVAKEKKYTIRLGDLPLYED